MSDKNKKTDLISEYYLRELNPEELANLQQMLADDPDARQEFVKMGRDEWLLHHLHHMEEQRMIHMPPRRSRRRSIQAIAASAAVLATLGVLFFAQSATITEMIASKPEAPIIGKVTECFVVEGEAISVVNNGHVRKLNSASTIREGDRLVIPPGCQLAFRYSEEQTDVRLGGNSLVHVQDIDGAKRIRLDRGRLLAQVARQQEGKPMRVVTRDAEVVVLGTAFEVFAEEVTRLSVTSGKVRFNSRNSDESRVVAAGYFSDTSEDSGFSVPFRKMRFISLKTDTLNFVNRNNARNEDFMVVDPERNAEGFMVFDLKNIKGTILEASLRLRVTAWQKERGGRGDLRLFRVHPGMGGKGKRVPVAHFSGGAGKGKDLVMDIDTTLLSRNENAFVLTLDEGGDDFWFSADEGEQLPVLEIKVAEER